MQLIIRTQEQFDRAQAAGHFAIATDVRYENLPVVTALPDTPLATAVLYFNLPGVTALPDTPLATDVWCANLPGDTVLPLATGRVNTATKGN